MKPVNLLPSDVAVASPTAGKPNMGMIGGAVAGVLAIAVVAGYFAVARVDSIKSETEAANQKAQEATAKTAAVNSQVQSLGPPVVDSDKQLAQGQEQVLVAAYTERHDFVLLAKELKAIMQGTNGWYQTVEASSAGGDGGATETGVEIVGFMPTKELMAAFNERANATRSLANAEIVAIETERLTDVDTRRPGVYFKFTMTADLVDSVAPSATTNGGSVDSTGLTVSNGGSGELSLSLDSKPRPKPAAAAAAKPAKPKNPFDVAATVAGGGS